MQKDLKHNQEKLRKINKHVFVVFYGLRSVIRLTHAKIKEYTYF